jgi:hypothetical protein
MAKFGGVALKSVSLFLRVIEFCCAAIVIGIFSYFLATMTDHHIPIGARIKAVEGISGAAVLYTIFALLLVCCLGGIFFFSLLALILDIAFAGSFAYVAYVNRNGRHSCNGYVNTFFGSGFSSTSNNYTTPDGGVTILPSFKTACKLETACFAVAIVAAYVLPYCSICTHTNSMQRLLPHLRPRRGWSHEPPQEGEGLRSLSQQRLHSRLTQAQVLAAKAQARYRGWL